jgi:HEAT repeat protein
MGRLLRRALQDHEAEVRAIALAALRNSESDLLQAARTDPVAQVRKTALRQIGMDGSNS